MNFTIWILNRIKTSITPDRPWHWLYEYRRLIMKDKFYSIMTTIFAGLLWFMVAFCLSMYFLEERDDIFFALRTAIYMVPAFYVYNWLAALYEIYDKERMATWEALKQDHQEYS